MRHFIGVCFKIVNLKPWAAYSGIGSKGNNSLGNHFNSSFCWFQWETLIWMKLPTRASLGWNCQSGMPLLKVQADGRMLQPTVPYSAFISDMSSRLSSVPLFRTSAHDDEDELQPSHLYVVFLTCNIRGFPQWGRQQPSKVDSCCEKSEWGKTEGPSCFYLHENLGELAIYAWLKNKVGNPGINCIDHNVWIRD